VLPDFHLEIEGDISGVQRTSGRNSSIRVISPIFRGDLNEAPQTVLRIKSNTQRKRRFNDTTCGADQVSAFTERKYWLPSQRTSVGLISLSS
jgi:hypothetical protein